ncbi:sigma-70 family RNA polymerase sigma factor [Lactiplantibacillus daoliensis]|uniref:Sigma-70 family RNA polymerase sigma factor n=1 Tax=Lactiplantibacillus daoliensis TaxID=2559916 RepID=A0ABW1UGD6_9LACO|nr:sigma-70 family RNA polymerase sigma factor [Lactiplantibacillus daoliensis]
MVEPLVMLVRNQKNVATFVYIVSYPALQLNDDQSLSPIAKPAITGTVTKITLNPNNNLYSIHFKSNQKLQLNPKNVLRVAANPDDLPAAELLSHYGYRLKLPVGSDKFQTNFQKVFPSIKQLKTIPNHYIVVDCEFGTFFKRQFHAGDYHWLPTTINGADSTVFQLAALSYQANQQTSVYFDRLLDYPAFLPQKKLSALAASEQTLAEFEQTAKPVRVLKDFIDQVLAPQLPLVFWDQRQDLKSLHWLLTQHFQDLSAIQQTIVKQPLQVFDGEQYTNIVINRSNKKPLSTAHSLPLNGVAGLLNIFNPHQHNALWGAQTTHYVVNQMARVQAVAPQILERPQPVEQAVQKAVQKAELRQQQTKYQLVHQLRATGKTYREIAVSAGISVSGVNYILKKAKPIPAQTPPAITNLESV